MMTIYVETSAILSWLFGEVEAEHAVQVMDGADAVVTSTLSILETRRALVRAESTGLIGPADVSRLRGLFERTSRQWVMFEMTLAVRERAAQRFPVEPVRSLDAVHLASVIELLAAYPDMKVLSFDDRIIANLEPLGLEEA
jgi:predicted nucleic acid-binding protein